MLEVMQEIEERSTATKLRVLINELHQYSAIPIQTNRARTEALALIDQMEGLDPACTKCCGVGKVYSPVDGSSSKCPKCKPPTKETK